MAAAPITLWCSFYPHPAITPALLTRYRALMTPAELAQAARFYFEKDRLRYTITRALVRTTLSRYADIAPEHWRFEPNRYGRPHIANDDPAAQGLSFNITHTDGLIILALGHGIALGVDAENTATRPVSPTLADSFFAPEEAATLRTVEASHWQQRFFEYWTLKESYIKARSMGLSIPLDKFSFSFPAGNDVELYVHPEQRDAPDRWRFWQFTLAPSYVAALCVERGPQTPTLLVKDTVPLVSETELSYCLVRSSR